MTVDDLIQELEGKLDMEVEVEVETETGVTLHGLQVIGFREEDERMVLIVGDDD